MAKTIHDTITGMDAKSTVTDALVLAEPDKELLENTMKWLNVQFTKQELYEICQEFHPLIRSHSGVFKRLPTGEMQICKEMRFITSQNINKLDMMRGLAFLLSEPSNLAHYVKQLSPEMTELWKHVLTKLYVSEAEAQKILNKDNVTLISRTHSYYYSTHSAYNVKGMGFFSYTVSYSANSKTRYGYRDRNYFVCLRPEIHQLFYRQFFPASDHVVFVSQLPNDQYRLFGLEAECLAKYNLLASMLQADAVSHTSRGLSLGDVKRTARKLGMAEAYPRDAPAPQPDMCSQFYVTVNEIVSSVLTSSRSKQKVQAYEDRMRHFLKNVDAATRFLLPYFYPHIKGLRKKLIERNRLEQVCGMLFDRLKYSDGRWVQIAEVLGEELSCTSEDIAVVIRSLLVFDPTEQSDDVDLVNEFSRKNFTLDSFLTEFGLTALRATAFMLSSIGLAEVALSPLHRTESPFAGVEYVRLTPLGRYAFELEQSYEAPHIEQKAYFELDPDRLIIRSLVDPNPYAQLLRDTSAPISKNRFETSASSFLANCKSREDVENKIAVFRQFISSELPPLWKQFFDLLLRHCHPLQPDTESYRHYRLSSDDTELIHLITTDEQLRRLVIRAEGYLILVRQADMRKFEEVLKKHGYLL